VMAGAPGFENIGGAVAGKQRGVQPLHEGQGLAPARRRIRPYGLGPQRRRESGDPEGQDNPSPCSAHAFVTLFQRPVLF
jgi:hypothetical protein